ncbi:hypothetical protein NTGM5_140076 [Candidatus Nitrotoga sp. M5]|nr:hypothetical protein NTGM5_140076 [Candidatus Nitrotoga sp. M5]
MPVQSNFDLMGISKIAIFEQLHLTYLRIRFVTTRRYSKNNRLHINMYAAVNFFTRLLSCLASCRI